jgi:hypothetical protein
MPKLLLPSKEEFYDFVDKTQKELGCHERTHEEIGVILSSPILKLRPKKKKRGIETCLGYENEFLKMDAWATFVKKDGAFRKHDQAWALITDKRFPYKPPFFSFPVHRTQNFLSNFYSWIKLCIEMINNWPNCPTCGERLIMRPAKGQMNAVELGCKNKAHKLPKDWKFPGLSLESEKFYSGYTKRYRDYTARDRAKGIFRTPQRLINSDRNKTTLSTYQTPSGLVVDTTAYNDFQYER